jgi:hypothetical protein
VTPYKEIIADRLILGAMAIAYEKSGITYQGPLPVRYQVNKRNSVMNLYFGRENIDVRNENGFEVSFATNLGNFNDKNVFHRFAALRMRHCTVHSQRLAKLPSLLVAGGKVPLSSPAPAHLSPWI